MKRTHITVLVLLSLTACNNGGSEKKTTDEKPAKDSVQFNPDNVWVDENEVDTSDHAFDSMSPLLSTYEQFTFGLDYNNPATVLLATARYERLFLKSPRETRDSGFYIFNRFYEEMDARVNDKHSRIVGDRYDSLVNAIGLEKALKRSKEMRDYDRRLRENGFKLSTSEGMTYVMQDRSFINKHFYYSVSKPMREYLVQVNKENEAPFAGDASMAISPAELASRIAWWESFTGRNPGFFFSDNALYLKKNYTYLLLLGTDNTPVVDDRTGAVTDYYRQAYEHLFSKYPESGVAKAVKPYYQALLNKNKAQAERLLDQFEEQELIEGEDE